MLYYLCVFNNFLLSSFEKFCKEAKLWLLDEFPVWFALASWGCKFLIWNKCNTLVLLIYIFLTGSDLHNLYCFQRKNISAQNYDDENVRCMCVYIHTTYIWNKCKSWLFVVVAITMFLQFSPQFWYKCILKENSVSKFEMRKLIKLFLPFIYAIV